MVLRVRRFQMVFFVSYGGEESDDYLYGGEKLEVCHIFHSALLNREI